MTEMTTYFCEICGDTFDNAKDCQRHELICAVIQQIERGNLCLNNENYLNIGQDFEADMDYCDLKEALNKVTYVHCKDRAAYNAYNNLMCYVGYEELSVYKDTTFPLNYVWNTDYLYWEPQRKSKPIATTDLPPADFNVAEWRERLNQWDSYDVWNLAVICTTILAERADKDE